MLPPPTLIVMEGEAPHQVNYWPCILITISNDSFHPSNLIFVIYRCSLYSRVPTLHLKIIILTEFYSSLPISYFLLTSSYCQFFPSYHRLNLIFISPIIIYLYTPILIYSLPKTHLYTYLLKLLNQ